MNETHPLKQYLIKHNIEGKQFAKDVGIMAGQLSNILGCKALPHLDTAAKIQILTKGKVKVMDLYETYVKYFKKEIK